MRRIYGYLVVLIVAGTEAAAAQLPPGYSRDSTVVLPDTIHEVTRGGRFRITLIRHARSAGERELITIAESLVPPPDSIEAAASKLTGAGWVAGFAAAKRRPGARWWWREWDGVWLPYALTGAAVAEYVDRVRTLSSSPNPFADNNPGTDHRASLQYTARVEALESTGGHRVELSAQFHFFCGSLCALTFRHDRVVIFDSMGRVIRVEGDRAPTVEVS